MRQSSDETTRVEVQPSLEYNRTLSQLEALRTRTQFNSMKLTPWKNIWASLAAARLRGNSRMIQAFYDTLFDEAVFDDRGAWSLNIIK